MAYELSAVCVVLTYSFALAAAACDQMRSVKSFSGLQRKWLFVLGSVGLLGDMLSLRSPVDGPGSTAEYFVIAAAALPIGPIMTIVLTILTNRVSSVYHEGKWREKPPVGEE